MAAMEVALSAAVIVASWSSTLLLIPAIRTREPSPRFEHLYRSYKFARIAFYGVVCATQVAVCAISWSVSQHELGWDVLVGLSALLAYAVCTVSFGTTFNNDWAGAGVICASHSAGVVPACPHATACSTQAPRRALHRAAAPRRCCRACCWPSGPTRWRCH